VTGAAPPLRRPKVLPVSIGGPILRSYFAGQLAFIRAQGFDVVIAAAGGPDLDALCRSEGVRGHAVPVFRPLRPWQDLKALLGLLAAFLAGVPRRIYHLRALPLEPGRGP
jgi:hypothetical protein